MKEIDDPAQPSSESRLSPIYVAFQSTRSVEFVLNDAEVRGKKDKSLASAAVRRESKRGSSRSVRGEGRD